MDWKQCSKPREQGSKAWDGMKLAMFFPGEKREGIINMTLGFYGRNNLITILTLDNIVGRIAAESKKILI
jgi:hypothetical protein